MLLDELTVSVNLVKQCWMKNLWEGWAKILRYYSILPLSVAAECKL